MCCGTVVCNLYLNVVVCAWRGARWNVGVMWNGVPRCGGVIWCTLWFDVKCGAMWNVAISDMMRLIEMQNV